VVKEFQYKNDDVKLQGHTYSRRNPGNKVYNLFNHKDKCVGFIPVSLVRKPHNYLKLHFWAVNVFI
jgi:hypothetical protein